MVQLLIPVLIAAMLAYMVWRAVFRLRHDRVRTQRHRDRGKFAFRPKERIRFLLGRSFDVRADAPEWEEPLISQLRQAERDRATPRE